jgi:hypothetical protein
MADDVLKILKKASAGLTYPSETDAPFEPFVWEGKGTARDQVAARAGKGKPIEEVAIDAFFKELEESDDAERFKQLRKVLEEQLQGLKVFRVGKIRIDVYLIGQAKSGKWAGLHTVSVET